MVVDAEMEPSIRCCVQHPEAIFLATLETELSPGASSKAVQIGAVSAVVDILEVYEHIFHFWPEGSINGIPVFIGGDVTPIREEDVPEIVIVICGGGTVDCEWTYETI